MSEELKTREQYQAAFSTWAESFLAAKQVSMSLETSKLFLHCVMLDLQGKNDFPELKVSFQYKIINSRSEYAGVPMSEPLKLFLCAHCESPGDLVMYIYALLHYKNKCKLGVLTVTNLAEAFPVGFPSKASLQTLWDLQKYEGHNLLDSKHVCNQLHAQG